ncbi:MAG: phosphatidylglycerophosphatase A [Gammaproteobacteria bacterium]
MSESKAPHRKVAPGEVFSDPVMLLAFGFGTGLAPKAPGTAGTVVGIPFAILLSRLPLVQEWIAIAIMSIAGIFICGYAAKKLGVHDHGGIVWDEVVGYVITVAFVPDSWLWLVLGFAFFRLFDIVKPWPIRELDHSISGGLGIMLDDVVAAIFAALCLAALTWGATFV